MTGLAYTTPASGRDVGLIGVGFSGKLYQGRPSQSRREEDASPDPRLCLGQEVETRALSSISILNKLRV